MIFSRHKDHDRVPIPYTRVRELNVFTVSNFLSVLRILLLPFIYYSLFKQTPAGDQWAIILLAVAALTDFLDGWMARIRNTISSFGKIIDPLADKLCMVSVIIFLIVLRGFPVWLFGLLLARDAAIVLSGALLIRYYKIVFPSNIWGKLYSFTVALLIAAYVLSFDPGIISMLETVVVIALAVSSFSYGFLVYRYIRTHYRHQHAGRRAAPGTPGHGPQAGSPEGGKSAGATGGSN